MYEHLCFCSIRLRTVVDMATLSFHRRIMGNWKMVISVVSLKIFDFLKEMFTE